MTKQINMLSLCKIILFPALILSVFNANSAVVIDHNVAVEAGTNIHSNIQLAEDEFEESVYLYRLTPEYKMSALDDKNEWYGNLGIRFQRASNSQLSRDRNDPFATLGWNRLLENGSFELIAAYTKQSTRQTQFGGTEAVVQDADSIARSINGLWDNQLSEKFNIELGAGYEKFGFSGDPSFIDYDAYYGSARLIYAKSESLSPYVSARVNRFNSDGNSIDQAANTFKYQDYIAGASYIFSPNFNFDVNTGVTRISTTGENEWIGRGQAFYTGERYTLTSEIFREIFPTALNRIDRRDGLDMIYQYDLSERTSLGAQLTLVQTTFDIKTQTLIGTYVRELSERWQLRGNLEFRNFKAEGQPSVDDKAIGLYFTYRTEDLSNENNENGN